MSKAPKWVEAGASVRVRGERWRVLRAAPHPGCAIVEVAGVGATNRGEVARFILPFETAVCLPRSTDRPRLVRPASWRRAARSVLAGASPSWSSLRAAAHARVDLLPYQLEPAIAMTRDGACRFLLADEVGLGKTIQTGLMAAELLAREPDARVLIVTPAALREQWHDELHDRFRIDADAIDSSGLAQSAASLPPDINPWSVPRVAIASIDFVKRPDVIRALEPLLWDLVAFDEAHTLAGRSDRAAAADLIARRARRVVAITATPPSSDDAAFERLCALGTLHAADPIRVFRRSRAGAGLPSGRSLRFLDVRPTPEEETVHRALAAYARKVSREASAPAASAARLAMTVLSRRACSSAASLARSAERRMSLLTNGDSDLTQLRLPIEDGTAADDDEPIAELAARGLEDAHAERRWLERIAALARAVTRESKIDAIVRLLRRAQEPAILFTQYRDTLEHLRSSLPELQGTVALLHGGLTARHRAEEARRFTHGDATLLLATDAASEGLNLHRRCRFVINLDVPWTPLRLEQRTGRVDRIGQSRRVHAVALVARGTTDAAVADALRARAGRASGRTPFDAANGLRGVAEAEARRVAGVRELMRGGTQTHSRHHRPVITVFRRSRRASLFLPLRLFFVDADDAPVWDTIAAVVLPCPCDPPRTGADVRTWLEARAVENGAAVARAAAELHDRLRERLRMELARSIGPVASREQAIADAIRGRGGRLAAPMVQPGLFDRRALRDAEAQHRLTAEALAEADVRLAQLEGRRSPVAGERRLAFAVVLPAALRP